MKQRNILYIEETPGFGGSTVSLSNIVCGLDHRKYKPYVILGFEDKYVQKTYFPNTKVFNLKKKWLKKSLGLARINGILRKRIWHKIDLIFGNVLWITDIVSHVVGIYFLLKLYKIELVHTNNGMFANVAGILAAWFAQIPCVCHSRSFEKMYVRQRILYPKVDIIVATSKSIRDNLALMGIDRRKIACIYNGLTREQLEHPYNGIRVRKDLGISERTKVFGIVGMLTEWKGHKIFLDAVQIVREHLPDSLAVIVGDTITPNDPYRDELDNYAKELGIEKNVIFTGIRRDIGDVFASMDVVVHASIEPEPFGLVIIEAMSASKPVIASRAGGPVEVVEDAITGFLFTPGDSEELAHLIIKLLRDPMLSKTMGKMGRKRVEQFFKFERTIEEIQQLYETLLTKKSKYDCMPDQP